MAHPNNISSLLSSCHYKTAPSDFLYGHLLDDLTAPFTEAEAILAIKSMNINSTPDSDGFGPDGTVQLGLLSGTPSWPSF